MIVQHVVDDRYAHRQGDQKGEGGSDEQPSPNGLDEAGYVYLIHAYEEEEQYDAHLEEEAQVFAGGHHARYRTEENAP